MKKVERKTYNLLKDLRQPACIVLGMESFTGLSIIRSLGVMGVPVIGVDWSRLAIGAFSEYCSAAEFSRNEEDLLCLLGAIRRISRQRNVIICESDKYLLFLDKYKHELDKDFFLTIPSRILLSELMNKKRMMELAVEAGIDTPRTFSSSRFSEEEIKKKVLYPCFIKPLYTQTNLRTKGEIAKNERELEYSLAKERFKGGYIVQEIIGGPETDIWIYAGYISKNLKVGVTCYKYRQIPRGFGVGIVAFSMKNQDVQEAGNRFLDYLNYTGLFCLEFKKDSRDGKYKLLEINPRICGQNQLFTFLGFNLPYIAYLDALSLKAEYPAAQKDGVLWVSVIEDFITCCRYYCHYNKLIFIDWIRKSCQADVYADFSMRDIKPFIFKLLKHVLRMNKTSN
ncbi:MAG: ATP-grasp domain-containing protein [Candidatus Omnitrophota bacterium]|jgi:predicted ATP-grasp superfamily ATP-dependent carboligase